MPTKKNKPNEEVVLIHNYILDVLMPRLESEAWCVLCVILRHASGWHTEGFELSDQELMKASGIDSMSTINQALQELVNENCIIRNNGNIYALSEKLLTACSEYESN